MIIGIDCTNIGYGGGGILVSNYLNAFHPKLLGIEKFVIWTNESFAKRLKQNPFFDIRIVKEAVSTFSRMKWQTFKLAAEAKQAGCTLLVFPGGLYLGSFRPFIAVAQNLLPFHKEALKLYRWKKKYFRYLLLRFLHIYTFKRAEQILYLSNHSKEIIEKYIKRVQRSEDRSQIKHTDNLFALSDFRLLPARRSRLSDEGGTSDFRILHPVLSEQFYRNKWTPPNNKVKKILYVSSLKLYKNHIPICRELKKRVDNGENLELVLVGDTNDSDAEIILKEIERLNHDKKFINVVGFVEHNEILKYYLTADFYIFPSICESYGLGEIEAEKLLMNKFAIG